MLPLSLKLAVTVDGLVIVQVAERVAASKEFGGCSSGDASGGGVLLRDQPKRGVEYMYVYGF